VPTREIHLCCCTFKYTEVEMQEEQSLTTKTILRPCIFVTLRAMRRNISNLFLKHTYKRPTFQTTITAVCVSGSGVLQRNNCGCVFVVKFVTSHLTPAARPLSSALFSATTLCVEFAVGSFCLEVIDTKKSSSRVWMIC